MEAKACFGMSQRRVAVLICLLVWRADGHVLGGGHLWAQADSWQPGPGDLIPFGVYASYTAGFLVVQIASSCISICRIDAWRCKGSVCGYQGILVTRYRSYFGHSLVFCAAAGRIARSAY